MQNNMKIDSSTYIMNDHPRCYDSMARKYEEYKCKMLAESLSDREQEEADVLHVLEELGYSLGETGTYFYKEIIMKAKEGLQGINAEIDYANLISEMSNNYSQFYFDIARNSLDIGLKSFHNCIELSYKNRVQHPMNVNLAKKIGINSFSTDYKGEALLIANYMLTKENVKSEPLVKSLGTKK